MIRVVVTDNPFGPLGIESKGSRAARLQARCEDQGSASGRTLAAAGRRGYVMTVFASITSDVIATMRRAKVIVRYGVGVDNIDLEAARSKGIPVCNVPDYCMDEVADHTLALILASTRQVVPNCTKLRGGHWGLAVPAEAMKTLCDLTVGVIGCGRIGREVIARLRPFKCRILVHDPALAAADINSLGCDPASLDELLGASDIVTLHCPSIPPTFHMLNRERSGG